jgi:hypothetical protein
MKIVHDDLIICHDCACYIANAEGDPMHDDAFAEGIWEWQGYDLILACHDEDGECESRSLYRCAVCKVQTFGFGHDAVAFARIPVALCAWCMQFGHDSADFTVIGRHTHRTGPGCPCRSAERHALPHRRCAPERQARTRGVATSARPGSCPSNMVSDAVPLRSSSSE